jgi:hypothetical protein
MDPDVTLEWLRNELKPELLDMEDEAKIEIDGVVQMFQALDEWISKGGFLPKAWVMTKPQETAEGIRRMSQAQRNRLWIMCGNYNVPFRENDYYIDSSGYACGWIGGHEHATTERGGTKKSTIYTGVSPEGEANT